LAFASSAFFLASSAAFFSSSAALAFYSSWLSYAACQSGSAKI
jgi:hypothetical protein